jgi:sigma-B regulation protein RsbU (phosphoserine phosphatase)
MSDIQPLYFTLLYGVLNTFDGLFRYVSAGQPGPILIRHHQAVDLTSPGMPIGLFEDAQFEEQQLRLEPGDKLLVFSDGLSEMRNHEGDVLGTTRLAEVAAEAADLSISQTLDRLLDSLEAWRAGNPHHDDMALLAVARRAQDGSGKRLMSIQFPSHSEQLAGLREQIRSALADQSIGDEDLELLILAVDEACGNIIQHGYGDQPGSILVTLDRYSDELRIGIRDWAPTIAEPNRMCGRSLDDLRPGGLGLHLINCGVDRMRYLTPPPEGGNHLEMTKQIGPKA